MEQGKGIVTASLSKGDWISPRVLEDEFGVLCTETAYNLRLQYLKKQIQNESEAIGRPLLCKQEAKGLRILTDEEALYYKQQQHRSTTKRLRRINHEVGLIDIRFLSSDDLEVLEEEKSLQQSIVDAISEAMNF